MIDIQLMENRINLYTPSLGAPPIHRRLLVAHFRNETHYKVLKDVPELRGLPQLEDFSNQSPRPNLQTNPSKKACPPHA